MNYIGNSPSLNSTDNGTASGIHSLNDQFNARKRGDWPGDDKYWSACVLALRDSTTDLTGRHTPTSSSVTTVSTTNPFGQTGNVLNVGGTIYYSSTNMSDFYLNGDFWIEVFVKPTSLSQMTILNPNWEFGVGYGIWHLSIDSGKLYFLLNNSDVSSEVSLYAGTAVNTSTFTHVAVGRSGANWYGFLNGNLVASASYGQGVQTTNNLYLGAAPNGAAPFSGQMSNLRWYKGICKHTSNFTPINKPFSGQA